MAMYDLKHPYDMIVSRWPHLVGLKSDFLEKLRSLLGKEDGHEAAIAMCEAVMHGKVKLDASDIEGGMKSIKPILQDVALYDSFRYAAIYLALRHGDSNADPTSDLWRSPAEAAYFRNTALPLMGLQDKLDLASTSTSSAGIPTPPESDGSSPDEAQTPSENVGKPPSVVEEPSTPALNLGDIASIEVVVDSRILQQVNKDLKSLVQRLNHISDDAQSQTKSMTNAHQRLGVIEEKYNKLLIDINSTRQMMVEAVPKMKDVINRFSKLVDGQSNLSGASLDAKQPAQITGQLPMHDAPVPSQDEFQSAVNSYTGNTVASPSFESISPECRNLRTQIYQAQLVACRTHDTIKFRPGIVGDCCASSISLFSFRQREAQIEGHMVLANRYRDKAQGEVDTLRRTDYAYQEEVNLKDVLRLLREIAPK